MEGFEIIWNAEEMLEMSNFEGSFLNKSKVGCKDVVKVNAKTFDAAKVKVSLELVLF